MKRVFIAGATGYVGAALTQELLKRGHHVCGLFRAGSESRLPFGCDRLEGNALEPASFIGAMPESDVYVHLIGVAHPSPAKAREFREIDLRSLEISVEVALRRGVRHFVFVSVARPAPVMKAYQNVRAQCEELIIKAGLSATILRPWYILGPGHWWPVVLIPLYSVAEWFGATRAGALRLGLVRHHEIVRALANVVEGPAPAGQRYLDVPGIRAA